MRVFNTVEEIEAHQARVRAGRGQNAPPTQQASIFPHKGAGNGSSLSSIESRTIRRGVMNKLESRFAAEVLQGLKLAGIIQSYKYESLKFRLATGAWYTPDFNVFPAEGRPMMYEVKGFIREASLVRIKVAAELYPEFRFIMAFRDKVKGWHYREF